MSKRFISIILVCLLVLSSAAYSVSAEEEQQPERMIVCEELLKKMADTEENEKLPIVVWMRETDTDILEKELLESVGFNRDSIRAWDYEKNGDIPEGKVDEYICEERRIYSERQYEINCAAVKNVLKFSDDDLDERNAFVSHFSPMITIDLTVEEIESLASFEDVLSIENAGDGLVTVYDPEILDDDDVMWSMNDLFDAMNITRLRDQVNLKGRGVTIGLVNNAAPNPNLSVFANSDIRGQIGLSGCFGSECACLLVSTETGSKGIVPAATLYCKTVNTEASKATYFSALEECIEIDANIICVAAAYFFNSEDETIVKNWTDHIAIQHSVHVVASVGDVEDYDRLTATSARAYNCIAVGNVSKEPIVSVSTRYQNGTNEADKPDISAFGSSLTFPHSCFPETTDTKTAYSTCMVAGILAQLLEYRDGLKTLQDQAKAVLLAGVSNEDCQFDTMNAGTLNSYHECGAGLVDAHAAYYVLRRGGVFSSYFVGGAPVTLMTHNFTVSDSNTKIRVSLTWLRVSRITSGSHYSNNPNVSASQIASLSLNVYDPYGNLIFSNPFACNCQVVQFNIDPDVDEQHVDLELNIFGCGEYTIQVCYNMPVAERTYFTAAWW